MKLCPAFLLVTFALLLAGRPLRAADVSQEKRNNGYSLLYYLCNEEAPLDLILLIKTTPPPVAELAHQISKTAHEDVTLLNQIAAHDQAIRLDDMGLPPFELDTRASIKADKQHQLLFGTSGPEFARALLVAQIEATTYGMHLAKVLAQDEPNAQRAAELGRISAKWQALRRRAYQLLRSL